MTDMDFSTLKNNLQPLEAADKAAENLSNLLSILTPANIEMIIYDARQLKIDTAESLEQCVDVIFEAAINSNCSSIVAILCTKLLFSSVPTCQGSHKMITFKEQIFEKTRTEMENFVERQALVNLELSDDSLMCHDLLASTEGDLIKAKSDNKNEESEDEKYEEIIVKDEDTEPDSNDSCLKKLKLQTSLFRFISELYLVDFLPSGFIHHSVGRLLDEESCNESTLETLYALLKLAGKKLELSDEIQTFDLSKQFKVLGERKSSSIISPHTRFMIEELFEMRRNNWQPVSDTDWIELYNLFLCDVEEKLYVLELWYGMKK